MIFSLIGILAPLLSALLALGLAAFVLCRNRRAWANRWLAIGLSAIGVYQAVMLASGLVGPGRWRLALFRLALAVAAVIPPSWLAFSLIFGESNGRSSVVRWRPALLALAAAVPLAWIALATGHVLQPIRLGAAGPLLVGMDVWGKVYFSVYLVALALVLLHLENLYRHASRLTRWKIKFLVVGVFVAFACQIVGVSYVLLYGFIHPLHPFLGSLAFLLGEGMIAFSLVRHRLMDVDIFVSRYVIYRSLTLALVGGYLLSLGVVAEVFHRLDVALDLLTGMFLAIAGAGALTLLLLSEDVRRKTQRFVHTHFYKHKYDYREEWMEFTRRLSRTIAVPEIAAQTVNRILDVMWVRQAAMYAAGGDPSGQMTLVYHVEYDDLPPTLECSPTVLEALRERAKVIPPTGGLEDGSDVTVALAREAFGGVPVGCLVPVVVLDAVVGLLVVGPEVSGKPFGVDDRDLLAAVSAQAGAMMLNARLSREASETRELQVLARLSAFVAHDLKNMVSTLSMLGENAKLHIGKPEFQVDAIRTVDEVSTKMRNLLAYLASPAGRAGTQARAIGLAPSVEAWMREISRQVPSRIRVETRLGWTPEVRVDPERFRSVLENLVLNAVEATPEEGTIQVETSRQDGYAVLTVTDTGRGMTKEFMQERLFHPFQTTKPRGLGIGLYQCRHIVQAFGGSLIAESQEGRGTRMIVRLPVPSDSNPWMSEAAEPPLAAERDDLMAGQRNVAADHPQALRRGRGNT
jgi:putative PEP-CTERM system histidine kinase